MKEIIQLKISLKMTEPPIWRRVLVDIKDTFSDLHCNIQIAMGWDHSQLFEFDVKSTKIGDYEEGDPMWGGQVLDADVVSIGEMVKNKKIKFDYIYDFGDSWEHEIKVEKFLDRDESIEYPICIDGALNCPPDLCGGVWRYYQKLKIMKDVNHKDHKEILEWMGEDFDPEHFDKELIN